MPSITYKLIKYSSAAILIFWGVVTCFIIFDPTLPPNLLVDPWGFDAVAVIIFIVAIVVFAYLVSRLIMRLKQKASNTSKMLLFTYLGFIGALSMSLLVELVFTVDRMNNFLTRSIFMFLAIGLTSWYLFIIDIFDNGVYARADPAVQGRGQFIANWFKVLILFVMIVIFVVNIAESVWRTLSVTETLFGTLPVLAIIIYDMISLLVKPAKMMRDVDSRIERIGLIALVLSGITLLVFFITFVFYNFSGMGLSPHDAYHARDVFYYVSMISIPIYGVFNYLGVIYPMKKN
jgi:hypothetical protein